MQEENKKNIKKDIQAIQTLKLENKHLEEIIEEEKCERLKQIRENEKIKDALKREQAERVEGNKDLFEIEERLKLAEKQMTESEKARLSLSNDLQTIQNTVGTFFKRVKETEELFEICSNFLQKNGVLANSFISENNIFE